MNMKKLTFIFSLLLSSSCSSGWLAYDERDYAPFVGKPFDKIVEDTRAVVVGEVEYENEIEAYLKKTYTYTEGTYASKFNPKTEKWDKVYDNTTRETAQGTCKYTVIMDKNRITTKAKASPGSFICMRYALTHQ